MNSKRGIILLCFIAFISLFAQAEVIRGDNGENVNWTFNTATGEFSIFGNGKVWASDSTDILPWYDYLDMIEKVHIASDVCYIGSWAFAGCTHLRTIEIPSSLTDIGVGILYNCTSISHPIYNDSTFIYLPPNYVGSFILPEGRRYIAGGAFFGCKDMTSIKIDDSYTYIGPYAFSHCSRLLAIAIKGEMKEIEAGTFEECSNLKTLKLPDSITRIGANAFSGCTSLTSFVVPSNTNEIEEKAFALCSSLSSIKFPPAMQHIHSHAFIYCDELHSVIIPNSSCKVDRTAFPYHCAVTLR